MFWFFVAILSHCIFLITVSEDINANGTLYITYSNSHTRSGLRIVYRPQNQPEISYQYSPNDTAFIAFYELHSKSGKAKYDEMTNSTNYTEWMQMSSIGSDVRKYFYIDDEDSSVNVAAGKWFGYTIHIIYFNHSLVYKDDDNFFEVVFSISYCKISASSETASCQHALDYQHQLSHPTTTEPIETEAFNGKGDIYITRTPTYGLGVQIAYRPDQNMRYGYDPAYIEFYELDSEYGISDYDEKIFPTMYSGWKLMFGVLAPRYYYINVFDTNINVTAGKWFGYAVHILSRRGELIYKDEYNFYQVPSSVSPCSTTVVGYYTCEQALDGEIYPTTTRTWTTSRDERWNLSNSELTGVIIGCVVGGLMVIACSILVIKLCCCKS